MKTALYVLTYPLVNVGGACYHRDRVALVAVISHFWEAFVGTKKTGKGRRKIGRKKRRNRAKIRHRK